MWKLLILLSAIFLVACQSNANTVEIPISEISGNMEMMQHNDVNYFAVLGSDGEPRVAFDACDVCGGSKGYSQDGDYVVCNNCGSRFKIDDLGSKNAPGGCWPSYLAHELDGDNIVIKESDLNAGAYRFK